MDIKHSLIDCAIYSAIRVLGFIFRGMPVSWALWCGRRAGGLIYLFDCRHAATAYANIRTALGPDLEPARVRGLVRDFFRSFGQNFIDVLLIPKVDRKYIERYIAVEGMAHMETAFKRGKGIVFLGVHEGSWEMYNIIAASLGVPFNLFVRGEERYRRVMELLNTYRRQKGCKLIFRQNQTRRLIEVLRSNESVGMSLDQGGKDGIVVPFFGKEASFGTGAVRLALKYDCAIIPSFYVRVKGASSRIILDEPYEVVRTGDLEQDVRQNVQRLAGIFERHIREYPQEYLWTYKIWKYGRERSVVILSDGKAGHLRQSESVARSVFQVMQKRDIRARQEIVEVRFRSGAHRRLLALETLLAGKYRCQGCLSCLRRHLTGETCRLLERIKADVVVSSGASLAPVNYLVSRENCAKSIVAMRPSVLGFEKFDLVVMPRHDNPPSRKNVCVTEGALNLIDSVYLRDQAQRLVASSFGGVRPAGTCIGLLLGGDTKKFHLNEDSVREVLRGIKKAAGECNAAIVATTSRRTSPAVERIVKDELGRDARCTLLIVANEKNIPEAVGGILGLSTVIVTSPESISMVSEAASSGRKVIVFDGEGLQGKHRVFLQRFSTSGYITVVPPSELASRIGEGLRGRSAVNVLDNGKVLREALERIL